MSRTQNNLHPINQNERGLEEQLFANEGASHHPRLLRQQEVWRQAGREVKESLQGLPPGAESNLLHMAQGLRALGIPYEISAAELVDTTTTAVRIGESMRPFAIQFEGQHEAFAKILREIEVPLSVRFRNRRGLSFGELTPEAAQNLPINETKLRYPGFFAAVTCAHTMSLQIEHPVYTTAERLRTDRNLAAAERLSELVDDFNHRRSDLSSVSLRITHHGEEPAVLSAGAPKDAPPEHVLLVRRMVLGEFGNFLRGEFFNKR